VTGILEFAGALGLLTKPFRVSAAWALIALLVAMFPANDLPFRTPLQLFWIAMLWWSTIAVARRDQQSAAHSTNTIS
jgi:hypothetical protein